MNRSGYCWHCGAALSADLYRREDRCPDCGRATHSCRNCRFYQPGKPNDCQEPVAERVNRKEDPNFCDYFEPNPRQPAQADSAEAMRQAAEDLFR